MTETRVSLPTLRIASAASGAAATPSLAATTGSDRFERASIVTLILWCLPAASLLIPQGVNASRDYVRESIFAAFLGFFLLALLLRCLPVRARVLRAPEPFTLALLSLVVLLFVNAWVAALNGVAPINWAKRAIPTAQLFLLGPFVASLAVSPVRFVRTLQVGVVLAGVISTVRLVLAGLDVGAFDAIVETRVTGDDFEQLTLPSLVTGTFAAYHLWRTSTTWRKIWLLALVFNAAGTYITQTRGLVLSVLGGIVAYGLAEPRRIELKLRKVLTLAVVWALVLAALLVVNSEYPFIPARFFPESEDGRTTVEGRLTEWEVLLTAAKETPLLGQGFGAFEQISGFANEEQDYSHNMFVFMFRFGGAIALVAASIMYLWLPYRLWRGLQGLRLHSVLRAEGAACLGGVVVLLICALTSTFYLTITFNIEIALFFAMLHRLRSDAGVDPGAETAQ